MQRLARMINVALALTVMSVGATVLAATPASATKPHSVPLTAASADQGGALSISFSTTLTKTGGVALTGKQAADVIYCGGTLTNPFRSEGAIRVSVVAFCSDIVDKIEIGVAMTRDGQLVAERFLTPPATNTDLADHFVVYGCPGTASNYTGAGAARFTKAGYVGSPLTMQGVSATVGITC